MYQTAWRNIEYAAVECDNEDRAARPGALKWQLDLYVWSSTNPRATLTVVVERPFQRVQ